MMTIPEFRLIWYKNEWTWSMDCVRGLKNVMPEIDEQSSVDAERFYKSV